MQSTSSQLCEPNTRASWKDIPKTCLGSTRSPGLPVSHNKRSSLPGVSFSKLGALRAQSGMRRARFASHIGKDLQRHLDPFPAVLCLLSSSFGVQLLLTTSVVKSLTQERQQNTGVVHLWKSVSGIGPVICFD